MPWKHALRDVGLVLVTLVIWRADATLRHESGVLPIVIAVAAGAMASFVGYLAHEWGHFIAARVGGSVMRTPSSPAEIFLFNFDSDRNGREQFLLMSSGGFLASAIVVVFFLITLPFPSLSSLVAFGLTIAGVVATAVLEVPPFMRVLHGGSIPRGGAYGSADPPLPS
jgi:hypothetical protein